MNSINEMGSREREKGRILQWIAVVGFLIWILSPIILDVFGYEKEPEYYLIALIPEGIMLLWIWSSFSIKDSASKNMRIGMILIFVGLMGMTLWLYFVMSFTISALVTMLEPLILILISFVIVTFVGVCYFLYSISQK